MLALADWPLRAAVVALQLLLHTLIAWALGKEAASTAALVWQAPLPASCKWLILALARWRAAARHRARPPEVACIMFGLDACHIDARTVLGQPTVNRSLQSRMIDMVSIAF